MSRISQPEGARGSLKWIQRAVNDRSSVLDGALLPMLKGSHFIDWRSPLRQHNFAEYRDAEFLGVVGLEEWTDALAEFWPRRGPQWDALGVTDQNEILLVEAKAHIAEMCSPPTQASAESMDRIQAALSEAALAFRAKPRAPWTHVFYQLANRLAHLHFLRSRGVPAWLILCNFIGDLEMRGPQISQEWEAAYLVAYHVMGIQASASLMKYVLHIYPDVSELSVV